LTAHSYVPKTEQFAHQKRVLDETWDREAYAFWWQQRCGKSKALIDNAGALHEDGRIDGMLLVAPNGLHRNFVTKELPKHLPERLNTRALFYRTDKIETVRHRDEVAAMMRPGKDFRIFTMSYDAFMTEKGKAAAWEYMQSLGAAPGKRARMLYALDESQRIKSLGAKRTVSIGKSAPFAGYRRILTGTPVSKAPWDTYPQIDFLDQGFWAANGIGSIEAMKATFAEWDRTVRRVPSAQAMSMMRRYEASWYKNKFPESQQIKFARDKAGKLVIDDGMSLMLIPKVATNERGAPQYKNLDQLREMLEPIRSRILKKDVFDLPAMRMQVLEHELSREQRRAYEDLRERGFTEVDGSTATAGLALTLLLRLQQIVCGYLPVDHDGTVEPMVHRFKTNPRLDMLQELCADWTEQGIIWARFRSDIDQICEMLAALGQTYARYDGTCSDDECAENEDRFHRGEAQWFVANQAKGGEGLDLTEAKTQVYYSNSFKLIERLQSLERLYGPAQKFETDCIDCVAYGTVDERIVEVLQSNMDMASAITGDMARDLFAPREERLL
jgi:hypothetical protein